MTKKNFLIALGVIAMTSMTINKINAQKDTLKSKKKSRQYGFPLNGTGMKSVSYSSRPYDEIASKGVGETHRLS